MKAFLRSAIVILLLIAMLSWLLVRSFAPQDPTLAGMRRALDAIALNESLLHADVLGARAGLLQNYDPLVLHIESMRAASRNLKSINVEARDAIDGIDATIADEEQLVESFKSANALLQNSLTYFDLLSDTATRPEADLHLKATAGPLVSAVAHLSQDASPEITHLVQERIAALQAEQVPAEVAPDIASLVLRARLLLDLLPKIDDTLRRFRDTSSELGRQELRSAIHLKETADERRAAQFRIGLFIAALSLAGLLVLAGARARRNAVAMRRRAHLEHLIGLASNQFIACPPEEISSRVDGVLRDFGEGTNPDRAYVVRFDRQSVQFWARPGVDRPAGWPEALLGAAGDFDAIPEAVIRTPENEDMVPSRLREVLRTAGVASWSCAKLMRGSRLIGVLCFERRHDRPAWLSGTAGLLRMQGDVIGNAFNREFMFLERQALEERLRQSQRLEAIGTFTSGVAHNFNNVIGTVLGHAEMAADAVPPGSVAGRTVTEIAQAGERAREIVSQILDFGRRGRATHFLSSPDTLLAETLRQLQPVLTKVELEATGTAGGALVMAEPAQLQQVLVNLVRNAEQASVPGQRIAIDLARLRVDEPRILSHGAIEPGPYVRLRVQDEGRGMDATTLSRLFEPFFTTKSAGTGLGLATACEIVTESGGAFDVRSAPGRGSTFEAWLPEARRSRPITEAEPDRGGTVLLVGANPDDVPGDEEVLAALGFEPVGFSDPAAALAALRRHPARFDVVLADKRLQGMSGLDFARAVRKAQPQLPILLCLSATDWTRAEDLSVVGITDVVRRPWRSAVLAATVNRSLSAGPVS